MTVKRAAVGAAAVLLALTASGCSSSSDPGSSSSPTSGTSTSQTPSSSPTWIGMPPVPDRYDRMPELADAKATRHRTGILQTIVF